MRYKRNNFNSKAGHLLLAAILLVFALISLLPFVYMFLMSLTQATTPLLTFERLAAVDFKNYSRAIYSSNFFVAFKNSMIVCFLACVFNALFAAMAAYGFAKKTFPGRDFIFTVFISTLMIPSCVKLIPMFTLMRSISLLNTYAGLALPMVCGAFGTFLIRQFMVSLPDELIESACIDGSGEIRTFVVIILPLVKPAIVSLIIFTFNSTWSDLLWPLVATNDSSMNTLTVALASLKNVQWIDYGLLMTGATLSFAFPFILYLSMQKQFVEGIALSGIKG